MAGEQAGAGLSGHVVVCNVNARVRAIVEEIWNDPEGQRIDVVLIVQDSMLWAKHPSWHPLSKGSGRVVELVGCPAEASTLRAACISAARAAVILADPSHGQLADARSALVGIAIERANPAVRTVMELNLSVNQSHLQATEVDTVICLGDIAEKLVAQSCVTPGANRLFAHLLTTQPGTSQVYVRPVPDALVGCTFRELARRAIRRSAPYVICGFTRPRNPEGAGKLRRLVFMNPRAGAEPGKDTVLVEQDELILLALAVPDLMLLVDEGRQTLLAGETGPAEDVHVAR